LNFIKQVVANYKRSPDRHGYATDLVGLFFKLESGRLYNVLNLSESASWCFSLEVPDGHVDTSEYSVNEQWDMLEKR
jgi:hypothetical protein